MLQNLPIGPYRFDATLAVTLEVGQVQETVSVQGSAPLVETRSPGIGQAITNEQVLQLPRTAGS